MKTINQELGESDNHYAARQLWESFYEMILYNNRFFIKHTLLDVLSKYIENNIMSIHKGRSFYRARIIDETAKKDHMVYKCYYVPTDEKNNIQYHSKSNTFRGLTKEASFVPPNGVFVGEGRSNPKYIRYLYMSEEPTTALFEVRPLLFDAVNLAKIETIEALRVANIAIDIGRSSKNNDSCAEHLMCQIQSAFSTPTNNPDDYLVTQIIAEYIKSLGYDGIRYNSSLHKGGVNYTIFNYEKCEAVSSQDFRIENYKITARAAFGSANWSGDLFRIIDNTPKFLELKNINEK